LEDAKHILDWKANLKCNKLQNYHEEISSSKTDNKPETSDISSKT